MTTTHKIYLFLGRLVVTLGVFYLAALAFCEMDLGVNMMVKAGNNLCEVVLMVAVVALVYAPWFFLVLIWKSPTPAKDAGEGRGQ